MHCDLSAPATKVYCKALLQSADWHRAQNAFAGMPVHHLGAVRLQALQVGSPFVSRLLHSIHHGRCPDQAVVHHSAPSLPAGLVKPHAALEVCILAHLNVHELQCTCLELPA